MSSENTPDQPDRIDPEAPTQQLPAGPPASGQAATSGQAPASAADPAPAASPAPAPAASVAGAPPAATVPTATDGVTPNGRFAWVSSPRVAAATVITVLALGGLGGAFALGRATAGHDHGPRDVMVQMGVPGGQGFDGRGFGHPRFWGEVPAQPDQGRPQQESPSTPAPSGSADG